MADAWGSDLQWASVSYASERWAEQAAERRAALARWDRAHPGMHARVAARYAFAGWRVDERTIYRWRARNRTEAGADARA